MVSTNLPRFPFGPYVKTSLLAKSAASARSAKYSHAFTAPASDDGSFDPSTIVSGKSKNPWHRSPPLELVFDVSDKEQFPDLASNTHVPTASTADATSIPTMVTQDIEAMIAKAMAEQDNKFSAQLAELGKRQTQLEASLASLTDQINQTLNHLVEKTVAAMMGPNSPFFTEADATTMMEHQNKIHDKTQHQFNKILEHLNNTHNSQNQSVVSTNSPPRKNQRTGDCDPATILEHDQLMSDARHEEVGEEYWFKVDYQWATPNGTLL